MQRLTPQTGYVPSEIVRNKAITSIDARE